jgi:hypothetical protein
MLPKLAAYLNNHAWNNSEKLCQLMAYGVKLPVKPTDLLQSMNLRGLGGYLEQTGVKFVPVQAGLRVVK